MRKAIIALFVAVTLSVYAVSYADMLMKAPTGSYSGFYRDGSLWTVDASGNVTVPASRVSDMWGAGFTLPTLPEIISTAISTASPTITAAQTSGAAHASFVSSGVSSAATFTLPTAAQMIVAHSDGSSASLLRIINGNTGSGVITVATPGATVVLSGTMTTAIGGWHDFLVSYATPTVTVTSIGTGTGGVAP